MTPGLPKEGALALSRSANDRSNCRRSRRRWVGASQAFSGPPHEPRPVQRVNIGGRETFRVPGRFARGSPSRQKVFSLRRSDEGLGYVRATRQSEEGSRMKQRRRSLVCLLIFSVALVTSCNKSEPPPPPKSEPPK